MSQQYPGLEPYIKKYGHLHTKFIEQTLPVLAAHRPDLDAHGIDALLATIIPKPKLPFVKMADGTLVPAAGITIRCPMITAGSAVALVVEGEETPLEVPSWVTDGDVLLVDLSIPGPLVLPAPEPVPKPEPTLSNLLRELAAAHDAIADLEGDDSGQAEDAVYELAADIRSLEAQIAKLKGS